MMGVCLIERKRRRKVGGHVVSLGVGLLFFFFWNVAI